MSQQVQSLFNFFFFPKFWSGHVFLWCRTLKLFSQQRTSQESSHIIANFLCPAAAPLPPKAPHYGPKESWYSAENELGRVCAWRPQLLREGSFYFVEFCFTKHCFSLVLCLLKLRIIFLRWRLLGLLSSQYLKHTQYVFLNWMFSMYFPLTT